MAYKKYNLGTFTNPVIDTLELSRTMDNTYARHSLSALVKRYEVPWDESAHHRGDYDAEGTALVFHKMLKKLSNRNIETMDQLDTLVSKDEIHKYGRAYHVNLLVKNKTGLKNLFKLISLANTTYLYKTPRILRSEIEKLAEEEGIEMSVPPMKYCTDNAAMIAAAGYYAYLDGRVADLTLNSTSSAVLE